MASIVDVEVFLSDFKTKLLIWDILYLDRKKNTQSLIDLELRPIDRTEVLKTLKAIDYAEGPLDDTMLNGADMWVFGKTIKGEEVYIKITLGNTDSKVICISFHIAEHPMNYPLK